VPKTSNTSAFACVDDMPEAPLTLTLSPARGNSCSPGGRGGLPPGQLAGQVGRAGAAAARLPLLARDQPEHFELVPVRVLAIQAQAVAVVGLAAQGAGRRQRLAGAGQVPDGCQLPGGVVEADPLAAGRRAGLRADSAQAEVVAVVAAGGPHDDVLAARGPHEVETQQG